MDYLKVSSKSSPASVAGAIAGLVKEKRIEGITDMRDESGRNGMRIVIEYKREANGEIILNQLYKYSQLEDTCAVNMLSLVGGEPKILPLTGILDEYIAHQESVVINRSKFELEKALARVHILEGYRIATDNIDEIVALMKSSPSIPESKARLCERFGLSEGFHGQDECSLFRGQEQERIYVVSEVVDIAPKIYVHVFRPVHLQCVDLAAVRDKLAEIAVTDIVVDDRHLERYQEKGDEKRHRNRSDRFLPGPFVF